MPIRKYIPKGALKDPKQTNLPYGTTTHEFTSPIPIDPTDSESAPIIIFPGIHGNGDEQLHAAEAKAQLAKNPAKCNIYIYYHPKVRPRNKTDKTAEYDTLQSQAEAIASEIDSFFKNDFLPYTFVGFSFGCALATLTAQCLEKNYPSAKRNPTQLYLIDGTSPELSQQYFEADSEDVTLDLISIFNTTARLCKLKQLNYNTQGIEALRKLNLTERISTLGKKILAHNQLPATADATFKRQFEACKADFETFTDVVARNLRSLIEYRATSRPASNSLTKEDPSPSMYKPRLPFIHAFITQFTAKKYQSANGGWNTYTNENRFSLDNNPEVTTKEHLDLLRPLAVNVIANTIHDRVKPTLEAIFIRFLADSLKEQISHAPNPNSRWQQLAKHLDTITADPEDYMEITEDESKSPSAGDTASEVASDSEKDDSRCSGNSSQEEEEPDAPSSPNDTCDSDSGLTRHGLFSQASPDAALPKRARRFSPPASNTSPLPNGPSATFSP